MKDLFYKLFCAIMLCLSFTGCSSDDDEGLCVDSPAVRFSGFSVYLTGAGHDMLNPENARHIDTSKIKVFVHGKERSVGEKEDLSGEYGPNFYFALVDIKKDSNGNYYLYTGEFASDQEYTDEKIIINWGDGVEDVIEFSIFNKNGNNYIRMNGVDQKMTRDLELWLNRQFLK